MDGAVLGYLDPWAGCLAMGSVLAMDGAAFAWGGVVVALAVLTKPQAVLVIPVAGLFLLYRAGRDWWKAALAASLAAAATAAVLLAPFARIGALANVRQGVGSLLRHDMLSAEAANAWWIVTWLLRASYAAHDLGAWAAWTMRVRILALSRFTALGYPNPRPIAALAAGSVIAWALWRARRGPPAAVLAAGALAVHAYFTLEVQVHENHLYLALPFMAAAAAVLPRLRGPFYLVSIVFALNLFLFYGFGRDFKSPSRGLTIVDATVVLSFVNVGALIWHVRRFSQAWMADLPDRPATDFAPSRRQPVS
jgi:4-amino-4-deoxy-L-arabinose transferase-like glycosyltransferase